MSGCCVLTGGSCQVPCRKDCEDLLEKIDRSIEDIKINGNFTRTSVVDGVIYRQLFRNHRPVCKPVAWCRLVPHLEEQ